MQIFHEITQKSNLYKGIPPLRIIIEEKKSKGLYNGDSLPSGFFSCACYHADTGHYLCEGKCDYPHCDCLQFSSLQLELKIIIRNIDLFKLDVADCGLESDPNFWIKFEKWRTKNVYRI